MTPLCRLWLISAYGYYRYRQNRHNSVTVVLAGCDSCRDFDIMKIQASISFQYLYVQYKWRWLESGSNHYPTHSGHSGRWTYRYFISTFLSIIIISELCCLLAGLDRCRRISGSVWEPFGTTRTTSWFSQEAGFFLMRGQNCHRPIFRYCRAFLWGTSMLVQRQLRTMVQQMGMVRGCSAVELEDRKHKMLSTGTPIKNRHHWFDLSPWSFQKLCHCW